MPRPTTKTELISAANSRLDKLFALIDTLPEGRKTTFTFDPEKVLSKTAANRRNTAPTVTAMALSSAR